MARYRLEKETIAVQEDGTALRPVRLPAGSEIIVLGALEASDAPNRQVTIFWTDQSLRMFAVDILERGTRIDG